MKAITGIYIILLAILSLVSLYALNGLYLEEDWITAYIVGINLVYISLIVLYLRPVSSGKRGALICLNLITFLSGLFYTGGLIMLITNFARYIDNETLMLCLIPISLIGTFAALAGIHAYKALNDKTPSVEPIDENTF